MKHRDIKTHELLNFTANYILAFKQTILIYCLNFNINCIMRFTIMIKNLLKLI